MILRPLQRSATLSSLPVSLLNASGAILKRVGYVPRPLEDAALVAAACRRAALDDFGGEEFRVPLRILFDALEREAALNAFGRLVVRGETMQLLINRLTMIEARKRHPAIAEEAIRRPIFIVGMPRSGTTLLHGLLAQDPANRAPLTWEAMHLPPAMHDARDDERRIAIADRQIRWFHRLVPEFQTIHAVDPRQPQECIAIMAHCFASARFQTTYRIPSYQTWLDSHDQSACYAFHRHFLQHLQYGRAPRRWVLKAPAHMFALDRLLAAYPDALVVQTHRDPVDVLASVASLTATLYQVFSDHVDRREIGAEVVDRWVLGTERVIRARRTPAGAASRILDVAYGDVLGDPIGTVRRIYAHFGWSLSERAHAAMVRFLAANPKNKHGEHRYALADFGIDRADVTARFQTYYEFFGLDPSVAPR